MFFEPLRGDGVGRFLFSAASGEVGEGTAVTASASAAEPAARSFLAAPEARAAEAAPPAGTPQADAGTEPDQANSLTREVMQRRQEELARREQDLKILEKGLDERLARLQELETRLKAMLKDAEEVQSAKFRHLVDVLSNMKAKQAASVLETLDEKIAVKVLAGMRGRQAGEILTFVDPGRAARLSESLARMQMPFE